MEEKILGRMSRLYVTKMTKNGVYLGSYEYPELKVLLPNNQVPKGTERGDIFQVFLYKDSEDRLIATTTEPYVQLGQMARLKVTDVTGIGAFLDWGLVKDLFLPFKEQTHRVKKGEQVLAALYIDKSSRLCATMKVYHYLKKESPYEKGDHVTGRIYEISNNFGAFVAVDDCYSGLIPKREAAEHYQVGEVLSLRVTAVKADGKLDLSSRERIPEQMNRDAEEVLRRLEEKGGVFDFTDKADPELIKEELGLTKNAFKRAVGRLLKQEKIEISNGKIVKK